MNNRAGRSPAKLAMLGFFLVALSLSGCGRKGPLDPPPGAAIPGPPVAAAPSADGATAADPATPASKRRSPLDWLIE